MTARQEMEKSLKAIGDYVALSEEAIQDANKTAHVSTNEHLHATAFDDTLSGTTAISVLLKVFKAVSRLDQGLHHLLFRVVVRAE